MRDKQKFIRGGEIGIRTLAGLASPNGFQDRPLQPLGYFSVKTRFGMFRRSVVLQTALISLVYPILNVK